MTKGLVKPLKSIYTFYGFGRMINYNKKPYGFSLTELLTTTAVIGVLSIIGVKGYQEQTYKAKQVEAKQSLSYVYSSQQAFKEIWTVYHENLIAVGAIPSGRYYYDVGFKKGATIDNGVGMSPLSDYPNTKLLRLPKCTNFYQICEDECQMSGETASMTDYFITGSCKVTTKSCPGPNACYFKDNTDATTSNLEAKPPTSTESAKFEVGAIGKLKGPDLWSINEEKLIRHKKDGTK